MLSVRFWGDMGQIEQKNSGTRIAATDTDAAPPNTGEATRFAASDRDAVVPRTLLAGARRAAIADQLRAAGSVSVNELENRFGISSMTARRDLADLERQGLARRTHGGAVMPSIAAHEDSFSSRMTTGTVAKTALAHAAAAKVTEGEAVFLDSSSTAWHVAQALLEHGVGCTVITNSLPIMELLATHASTSIELIGIGGQLRVLTQSFVGPFAVHTTLGHFADRCFFSVKGVTADGALTDADPLEAEIKRAMIAHAEEATLLADRSKLSARGLNVIGRISDLSAVYTDGPVPADLRALADASGVHVESAGEEAQ
jgi:DeoR/GlpR family transcriptional regulator of sugar metabolism